MAAEDSPNREDAPGTKRKLAAILHADVVGYSRLMSQDEVGTHARLKNYRETLDGLVLRHDGRVVGTAGDAVLADFPSVIEALSAAVEIQNTLAERNQTLSAEERLEFRIGINLGDVIVDGDDIFGHGVNVAARVESLADAGGIALSASVYDQVKDKLDLAFHDRGTYQVKNIAEPVRVYAVGERENRTWWRVPTRRFVTPAIVSVVAIVVVGMAAALVWLWDPFGIEVSGKPTIAVLPFENRSSSPAQAYFSDGVTEDVIVSLGRFSSLLVLSWNAVAPYKGQNIAPEQMSRDLDVRYVVGGTVQQVGDRLRIAVQLTDAARGVLLWSDRYDEKLDDVFAVQERISNAVVGALAVRLTQLEQERTFEKPTDSLDAYDHVLRGRDLLRRIERDANLEAREMFQRAVELDERYSGAFVGLGFTHIYDFMYGWTEWPSRAIRKAQNLTEQAVRLDNRNGLAHALLAHALAFQRSFDRAEREIERAIELNPNNSMSLAVQGSIMLWMGRPEVAVPPLELALRLDPRPAAWWLASLAKSYYLLERYEDAVQLLNRFEPQFKEDPAPYAVLAAAYGQLGQLDQAARAREKVRRLSPFFDSVTYAGNIANAEHSKHLLEGLQKAGLD